MKSTIRRFLTILLVLIMSTAILVACGGGQAPAGGQPQDGGQAPAGDQAQDNGSSPAQTQESTDAPTQEASQDPYSSGGASDTGAAFHGAYPYKVPPEGHFNSFAPNGIPSQTAIFIYWSLLEMPGAMYRWGDQTWMPLLAEDWETKPPDTFVMHVRKGVKWSDGNEFTAKDVLATFNVGRLFKWTVFDYVDNITAVDDYTVEFHMHTPSTVVERYVLTEHYRSAATYGHLAERVAEILPENTDPQSDEWKALVESDEWKALAQEASEFRPDDLIVTGPFKLDINSITEAQLSLVKNPSSYLADTVQFDKIVIYNGETPAVTPLVLAGDVDYATHGFPPATEKAFLEQGIRIIRAPTYSGPALYFNHDIYPLNRYEVRQAIAYAVDRSQNGTVALGDSGIAVEYMAGISDNLVQQWLTEQQIAELNTYEHDPKKAEEILTGIGFKRDSDDVWVDDQGNRLEYELIVPAEYADWSAAGENLGQQLSNFGIKVTVRGVQFQQQLTDVNQGNFQMAIRAWGIGTNPHPHFSFRRDLIEHNYAGSVEGKGMNFPLQQTINGKEVDFQKLMVDSAAGLDPEAQGENVAAAAVAFNEVLPIVPLWERYGNNPALNQRVTDWPADSDVIYKNAVYGDNFVIMMILDGTLKPNE